MPEQEMIDVFIKGELVTTVPKSSEQHIRKHYSGKPEDRLLSIVPHGYKSDSATLDSIRTKLNPLN